MARSLTCFAHGRDGEWEAICVDLDIAVQGQSLEDVRDLLSRAIRDYVDSARREEPAVRDALLSRRAPLWVRIRRHCSFLLAMIRHKTRDDESAAGFTIPCPA